MVRPGLLVALLVVMVPLCVMLLKPSSKASVGIIVNTLSDPFQDASHCSLRGAITSANTGTDSTGGNCPPGFTTDIITFDPSIANGTILLGSTLPGIVHTLTIDGTTENITVSGATAYQVLVVNPGATLDLND
jgi:CSLREA domain-containing protein